MSFQHRYVMPVSVCLAEGLSLGSAGKTVEACAILDELIAGGDLDALAMRLMTSLYTEGEPEPDGMAEKLDVLERADHPHGLLVLGLLGVGELTSASVTVDPTRAMNAIERSAVLGHADAQRFLGRRYFYEGDSPEAAAPYFEALLGDFSGTGRDGEFLDCLAQIYGELRTPPDLERAAHWREKSATYWRARALGGDQTTAIMLAWDAMAADDFCRATEYLNIVDEASDPEASLMLAYLRGRGLGLPRDEVRSRRSIETLISERHLPANFSKRGMDRTWREVADEYRDAQRAMVMNNVEED